jgi:phage FluMu protein Com
MILVTCNCKKMFIVEIPAKEFEIEGKPENTFLVAKCPHCNMLTRFKPEDTKEIEKGSYAGNMEINEQKK